MFYRITTPIVLCALPLTFVVEKLISCLTSIKSTIKDLPIQSTEVAITRSKKSNYLLLYDQIDPSARLFRADPKQTSHFKLKSNSLVINSYNTLIFNSRLYSVEKIQAPFLQYLHFLFGIADNLNLGHLTYLFNQAKRKFTHLPSAPFSLLNGGDILTIFAINDPQRIINLSKGIVIRPEIIMQGNKSDISIKLGNMINHCQKMRLISTIPLVVLSVISIGNMIWKYIPKIRSFRALSNKGKCERCQMNQAQVIIKNCNHFNICINCFEEMGRKCYLCEENHPNYLIITNK